MYIKGSNSGTTLLKGLSFTSIGLEYTIISKYQVHQAPQHLSVIVMNQKCPKNREVGNPPAVHPLIMKLGHPVHIYPETSQKIFLEQQWHVEGRKLDSPWSNPQW